MHTDTLTVAGWGWAVVTGIGGAQLPRAHNPTALLQESLPQLRLHLHHKGHPLQHLVTNHMVCQPGAKAEIYSPGTGHLTAKKLPAGEPLGTRKRGGGFPGRFCTTSA